MNSETLEGNCAIFQGKARYLVTRQLMLADGLSNMLLSLEIYPLWIFTIHDLFSC